MIIYTSDEDRLFCYHDFDGYNGLNLIKRKAPFTEDSEFLKLISPFIKELTPSDNLFLHEIPGNQKMMNYSFITPERN